MLRRHLEWVAACALAAAAVAAVATPARAAVQITSVVATPVTQDSTCSTTSTPTQAPQAGAFNDLCLALALDGGHDEELPKAPGLGDDARNVRISLPPGEVASPQAATMCAAAQFHTAQGCAASAQVGTMSAAVDGLVPLNESLLQGRVYLLEPEGTEAALLGLEIDVALGGLPPIPVIRLESPIRLRTADGGLDAVVTDIPREVFGLSIEMRRLALRLWGSKTQHPSLGGGFVTTPTDCSHPATTTVDVTSYANVTTSSQASFTPTDCGTLPFTQSLTAETDRGADAPTKVAVTVAVPPPAEPRAFAHVRGASIVVPRGFELSPAAASGGLGGCSDAQFGRPSSAPSSCPADAEIGDVAFDSPLLTGGPLHGRIFLGESAPGKKIRFFAIAESGPEEDAIRVKIEAVATVDPDTGQITVSLTDLPPLPFTSFRFAFRGGDHAIVASPRSCGTQTMSAALSPLSGGPDFVSEAPVTTDQGCEDPARFTPSFGATVEPTQAAGDATIVASLSRPDGHARMSSAIVHLPPGLAGRLGAAPLCPRSTAEAGGCPEESRVGSVTATAGEGPAPLTITGAAFLTEGAGGDPAGLALAAPVRLGPLDFGQIIVLARLAVRPTDQGLDLVVDHIPQRIDGIATAIRTLEVRLDRPGFAVNGTACAAQQITATLGSDLGASADLSAPYQATGCDRLRFAPALKATLTGGPKETRKDGHPGLTTTVTQGSGQANSRRVRITMPKGISVDVDRIDRGCPLATYDAGACSPTSVLGTATASTPLIPSSLSGPVTMVTVPGVALPELRIALRGLLPITLRGQIGFGADNRTVATVDPLPDVPLARFDLSFAAGAGSLLQASQNLCALTRVALDSAFESQAGSTSTTSINAQIPGCEPSGTVKVSALGSGRPTLDLRVAGGRTRVTTAQLRLPRGMALQRTAVVRKRLRLSATGLKKGTKAKVTVTGQSLRVTTPAGQSAQVLRVRLAGGAVRVSPRLRRHGRAKLAFRLQTATADGRRATATLRTRPAASARR